MSSDSSNEANDSSYFDENSDKVLSRLQVRFADGELERLGIVNLEKTEQSKLYVCHIAKDKSFEDINKVFSSIGEIEELYLFKDTDDEFKGSCFIKYTNRKESLKAI